ncbi:helix-turn-helix domain-containing protein [Thioalkalivibrio sp.]|uniref:helix-turn-helix domain-containing protein n=1 Tax=Thioalkalivibrio sp. TaxID=2093813 RepID=UPI0039749B41
MQEPSNPHHSTGNAAAYLGNSERTLARWRSLREGPPYIRVGRKVRYLQSDLDEWLARHRVHPVREGRPVGCGGGAHQRPTSERHGR